MNNEEKILKVLEKMQEEFSGMKETQDRMQEDLSGMKENLSDLRQTATRVAITQENVVLPQLRLLAEGQQTLLDTLAPKDRVDALEGDVALLKDLVRSMSQRITALEKAQ